MAKLKWHELGTKKYETGVDRGVLYPVSSGEYTKGVAWNGLTAVSESPSGGEETKLFADNVKYGSIYSADEYGGTIECYTYPDEWEECDGSRNLGDGISIGQQRRKPFGLSYRTLIGSDENPDEGYKIHLVYGATASPSEKSYATVNESPEAITFSYEFNTTPVNIVADGFRPTSMLVVDSTKVTSEILESIESILYGTDGEGEETAPRLPLPDEILTLLNA